MDLLEIVLEKEPAAEPAGEAPEPSAEQLAALARGGDVRAFERLVERFETRIFNYLLQMTRHRHDAEDLTQETFVKAYRALSRFAPVFSFNAWLFTIAKRTALNHFRSARARGMAVEYEQVDFRNPASALESKDEEGALWNLARTLKPVQHEALWLHYGEGFSLAEVARIMDLNAIHTRVVLHRARAALAQLVRRRHARTARGLV